MPDDDSLFHLQWGEEVMGIRKMLYVRTQTRILFIPTKTRYLRVFIPLKNATAVLTMALFILAALHD
jgi:hypothetical protein